MHFIGGRRKKYIDRFNWKIKTKSKVAMAWEAGLNSNSFIDCFLLWITAYIWMHDVPPRFFPIQTPKPQPLDFAQFHQSLHSSHQQRSMQPQQKRSHLSIRKVSRSSTSRWISCASSTATDPTVVAAPSPSNIRKSTKISAAMQEGRSKKREGRLKNEL